MPSISAMSGKEVDENDNGGHGESEQSPKRKNAFSELMASASKSLKPDRESMKKSYKIATFQSLHSNSPLSGSLATTELNSDRRDELLGYIKDPAHQSVIYSDEHWVLIKDKYPKSSVHCLLLPRNPDFYPQHPYRAFSDPEFLQSTRDEVQKAVLIVCGELRRIHGSHSKTERIRIEAMESDDPPEVLPPGRDWNKDVLVGVHGYPSMNHLHIHILSKDRFSPCMKHAKHYNTFQTKFFVPLDDFPLDENDPRWQPERLKEYTDGDLICWKCGRNFKRSFKKLEEHLGIEFEDWRKE